MSNEESITSLVLIASTDAADGGRTLARSDRAAIHMALRYDKNVAAVCPASDTVAIEYASAAGIRNFLECESLSRSKFPVVYVGAGAAELVGDTELARWADLNRASLLFDVIRCSEVDRATRDVECDAGRGARYHLRVRGALFMVMSSQVARPAYLSRYRRRSAAHQLFPEPPAANEQPAWQIKPHEWNPVRPRVRVRPDQLASGADDRMNSAFSIEAGGEKDTANAIVAAPETCARHILRYLAHHGFVTHIKSDNPFEPPEIQHRSTEPRALRSIQQSTKIRSLTESMERRPRQADDLPARRARQPRSVDEPSRSGHIHSIRDFVKRRPRQSNDSSSRHARQPRPVEWVE